MPTISSSETVLMKSVPLYSTSLNTCIPENDRARVFVWLQSYCQLDLSNSSRENKLLESLKEVTKCRVDGSRVKRGLLATQSLVSISPSLLAIGHFRVHLSLHFKARLSAKSLLWKSVFNHIETGTNYHNKNLSLRLALKERLRRTQKWLIVLYRGDYDRSNRTDFERLRSNRERLIRTILRVIRTIKWTPGLNFHFFFSQSEFNVMSRSSKCWQ